MFVDEFEYDYFEPAQLVELLEPGDGKFIITECIPKTSKSGNAMLSITMEVTDCNNKMLHCYEYLVRGSDETSKKRLATKIRNIAKAIGKPQLYAEGYKLKPLDLVGSRGACMIKTQEGDGDYPPKSVVAKYYAVPEVDTNVIVDDELPWS